MPSPSPSTTPAQRLQRVVELNRALDVLGAARTRILRAAPRPARRIDAMLPSSRSPRRRRALEPSLLVLGLVLVLAGCEAADEGAPTPSDPQLASGAPAGGDGAAAESPAVATTPPDASYVVRAQVMALPAPGTSPPELIVHHEAIPSFADARNRVVGMDSMEMPFALGPGVRLDGIAVGDPVEMRLEMRWAGNPPATLATVRELPPGTPLQLSR